MTASWSNRPLPSPPGRPLLSDDRRRYGEDCSDAIRELAVLAYAVDPVRTERALRQLGEEPLLYSLRIERDQEKDQRTADTP